MSRRKGRILAFQALYSWDVSQSSLEDLLTFSWTQKVASSESDEALEISDATKNEQMFASLIISGTISHIEQIDKLIESHLTKTWNMDRISKVTLAILRVSIYEMVFQPDSEIKIIIDEAVKIAKEFGTDDSYKFINAVLDKIGSNGKQI